MSYLKYKHSVFFLMLVFCLGLISCSKEEKKIKFEVSKSGITSDTLKTMYGIFSSKGIVWENWEKLFDECMESEMFDEPVYMGLTNSIGLGSIVKDDFRQTFRVINDNNFTEAERKNIIKLGEDSAPCDYKQEFSVNFNLVTGGQLYSTDSELQLLLSSSEIKDLSVNSWRKDELITDELADILNSSNDQKKIDFKKSLLKDDRLLLVKTILIKGFSATVKFNKQISAELKTKLEQGVTEEINKLNAEMKFQLIDNETLQVKTQGNFIVFGQFVEAKEYDE